MRRKALTAVLLYLIAAAGEARAAARSIAFYSEGDPPLEPLALFDDVVLQPTRVSASDVAALRKAGAAVVAALPTEIEATEAFVRGLSDGGFAGFVIDACTDSPERSADLFELVRRTVPAARVFWRCPQERPPPRLRELDSVVVEDVFTSADASGVRRPLPDNTRRQLQASLKAAYLDKGVAVIALERMRPNQRPFARELARELARAGITPWLSTGALGLGVGLVEAIPRRVLGLYDSANEVLLPYTVLHRMAALPLEYLGYVLEYRDVRRGLPEGDLGARYAGIVTWFAGTLPQPLDYARWLETQIDRGVRVAILGSLGAAPRPALLERLGLASDRRPLVPPVIVAAKDDLIGKEAQPLPLTRGLPPWSLRTGTGEPVARHLDVRDATGRTLSPVVTGGWGGFAFDPYVLARGPRSSYRWLIDPFAFFERALALPPMPAVDVTTESGRRMLLVQIDGDGFHGRSTLPNHPYAGEVILRDFLQVFRVPTTVSFVEGEIGPAGLNPKLSGELEPIAREITGLAHVELASHTFSHPFDWLRAAGKTEDKTQDKTEDRTGDAPDPDEPGPVHLPIAGYRYSAQREVRGSVEYLNQRIAPPGKKVKAVLWSGNALPDEQAVREAARLGLANVNGVNCDEPYDAPGLTQVPSLYRPVGEHLQIYAPAHNENVYIQTFRNGAPIYGFRKVIKQFEFTEKPRRLKPIDIYYHFYSGASEAATSALREVYLWALKQETIPLHLSEYAARAAAFPGARQARRADGSWELHGLAGVRTVRLPEALGWPDLSRSLNVIGVRSGPDGRFVSVLPGDKVVLALASQPPREPHLVSANARVVSWTRDGGVVRFRLRGHLPVELTVGGCAPVGKPWLQGAASVDVDRGARVTSLRFSEPDTQDVVLSCER
jgi:polysaccharide biosynthesis protein PelA